jgi:hypothetical protein
MPTGPQAVRSLLLPLAVVLLTPDLTVAQAPERPQLPRLQWMCPLREVSRAGWLAFSAPALGVRIPYPQAWAPRVTDAFEVLFVADGRVMLRARKVDTEGLDPLGWLRARVRSEAGRSCWVVALGVLVGDQCFDELVQTWTTFLATTGAILAIEEAAVDRDTYCTIVKGVEELDR